MVLCLCLFRVKAWQEMKRGCDLWDQLGAESRKILPISGLVAL